MITECFLLDAGSITGDFEWPDDEVDAFIKTWEEIESIYSSFMFTGQSDFYVNIDWRPFLELIRKNDHSKISEKILRVEIRGDIEKRSSRNHMANHLDLILSNVFLVANISCPGCLNLFGTKYNTIDKSYGIKLSSTPFYETWHVSKELHGWPNISKIPLHTVVDWFNRLNIGVKQLADTSVEKTLFSLLHFCKDDTISPNSIIWFMHALEAFYDTPADGIKRSLRNRIMLVLGVPRWGKEKISKIIGKLYDERSAYVHGSSTIHHPLYNDIFDKRIDNYVENLLQRYGIAAAIVVASIQKLVCEDWTDIKFEEFIQGVNLHK